MTASDAEKRPGQIIHGWWFAELGDRKLGSQETLSARLRRGDDVTVLCQPPVHVLAQQLGLRDGARIARLARVLAHVRAHVPVNLPRQPGQGDLSGAFHRAVAAEERASATALAKMADKIDQAYGACCDDFAVMDVAEGQGTLAEIAGFAAAVAETADV